MIRALLASSCALSCLAGPATAEGPGDVAGDFDYYVLALSWSPNWCALEGDERGSPQCGADANGGAGFAWVLHGLWPQREEGWPEYCRAGHPDPSRAETRAMADVMGTDGLAWHQWERHGSCSGLSPADYFRLARLAFERAAIPDAFARLPDAVDLPAAVVEEAFLREDPGLSAAGVAVTCREGLIQEVRLCLTRDLEPRACGADVGRGCALEDARMEPVP